MSEPKRSKLEKQRLLRQQYNIPNPDEIAVSIGLRNLKGFFDNRPATESQTQNAVESREQE